LTHAKLLRISESSRGKAGLVDAHFVDANHRQVARRIVSDGAGWHAPAVGQSYFDAARVVHNVAVGENQAIGSEYESRASATAFARLAGAAAARSLMHFDVHHRRTDTLYCARDRAGISIEDVGIGVGNR
jgi:hypothetical protein